MLRPITPFVEYAVNYDYISKVLCVNKDKPTLQCNGKCHLVKELKKQQDDDFKSLQVSMEEYPIGFIETLNFTCKKITKKLYKKYCFYQQPYSYEIAYSLFHPPINFIL